MSVNRNRRPSNDHRIVIVVPLPSSVVMRSR